MPRVTRPTSAAALALARSAPLPPKPLRGRVCRLRAQRGTRVPELGVRRARERHGVRAPRVRRRSARQL